VAPDAGFWKARWTAIKLVGVDLALLLLPLTLLCDHSYDAMATAWASDARAWLSLLAIIAILTLVVVRYRQDRIAFWAAGFFGITLLPTSNLVFLIGAGFAERFLYLPAIPFAIITAALLYRLTSEQLAKAVLIALIVLYAAWTVVRNPDWDNDLSLASADLPNSPQSFCLHYKLARVRYQQDALGNIDRAIAEGEAACMILSPLLRWRSITFPADYWGIYYATKAQLVSPGERTAWLEKSRVIPLRAREISRALEKDYAPNPDRARLVHDARLRWAVYLSLASTCMELGRYQEAVEALRYAQGVNSGTLTSYDGLSQAYFAIGNLPMAIVAMEEKGLVDHFQMSTMRALRGLFQKVPDGSCAFAASGAGWRFNMEGCPRVKGDMCAAYAGLERAYRDARVLQGVQWAHAAEREHSSPVPPSSESRRP
jgi:tetratricopeptide (TPR) repeat protein